MGSSPGFRAPHSPGYLRPTLHKTGSWLCRPMTPVHKAMRRTCRVQAVTRQVKKPADSQGYHEQGSAHCIGLR